MKFTFTAIILFLLNISTAQTILCQPISPSQNDKITLFVLSKARTYRESDTLFYKLFEYAKGNKNLVKDTFCTKFDARFDSNYDLKWFKLDLGIFEDSDSISVVSYVQRGDAILPIPNQTVSLVNRDYSWVSPIIVSTKYELPINVIFAADKSLSKFHGNTSGSEILRKESAITAILMLLATNSTYRSEFERFSFYIDNQVTFAGGIDTLINQYLVHCNVNYEVDFDALIVLHGEKNGDSSDVLSKIGTSEYYCGYSMLHELTHIIGLFSDEYSKVSPDGINWKGRFIDPYHQKKVNLSNLNVFKSKAEASLAKAENCKDCLVSEINLSYINNDKLVDNNTFYKICDEDCLMSSGRCYEQNEFGKRCESIFKFVLNSIN